MRLSLNLENVIPGIPTAAFKCFLAWVRSHISSLTPKLCGSYSFQGLGDSLLPTFYKLLEINLTWFNII